MLRHNYVPLITNVQSTKYRPLVIRMFIACVAVAIALMVFMPPVANAADLVNVNKASMEGLQTLPNIGEKRAKAIISYRKKNGGFKDKKDLLNVDGIGEKILAKISRKISVTGGGLGLGSSSKRKKSTAKTDSKTSTSKSKSTSKSTSSDKTKSSTSKSSSKTKSKSKSSSSKPSSKTKTKSKKKTTTKKKKSS